MSRVIVIGAGMGGLAAAIDLARAGCHVTVIERANSPGGKLRQLQPGDRPIDAGPTVFTLRAVFDALFEQAGARLEDYLAIERADILARHAWRGSDATLDLFADREQSAAAIDAFAGAREAQGYLELCQRSAQVFDALRDSFMTRSKPSTVGLLHELGAAGALTMLRTPPWQSLWSALGDHFRDQRLRQLFARYATYVGSSPLAAPATLMLIAHVEQSGVWLVKGGMKRVALALEGLARSQGVEFRYRTHCESITVQNGRASGVTLTGGESEKADVVVFNGDVQALAAGLLGAGASRAVELRTPTEQGLSAITWCLDRPTRGFALEHHNVFFGHDYPSEFRDIFERRRVTTAPTIYICAQDRGHGATALPEGSAERLLMLVNAPADGDRSGIDDAELQDIAARSFALLADCGLHIDADPTSGVITRPQDFAALFPGSSGSLYGRANHGMFASFEKPGSRTRLAGLYVAGGSAHPGPGVPMATLSGRLAAAAILEDQCGGGTILSRMLAEDTTPGSPAPG